MKRSEIQNCTVCNKGIMNNNAISFYRVTIEHMVVNLGAIRERAGYEIAMGIPMAGVLAPDKNLANALDKGTVLVCENCGVMNHVLIASLHEKAGNDPKTPATSNSPAAPQRQP